MVFDVQRIDDEDGPLVSQRRVESVSMSGSEAHIAMLRLKVSIHLLLSILQAKDTA